MKPNPAETSQLKTQIAAEYIRQGDLDLAKRALDEAIDRDSSNALAKMMMAVTYQIDGGAKNQKLADEYYQRAVSTDPKEPQIRNNYGQFLFTLGRYEEAAQQFEIAGDTIEYTNRGFAYANLGQSYVKLNRMDDAKTAFLRALRIDKKNPSATLGLAGLYYSQGAFDQAFDIYRNYMEIADANTVTETGLIVGIRILSKTGDHIEMKNLGGLLLQKYPNSIEASEYRAKYKR
ncbi:uncharacterized protein LOC114357253 [Ostrinia furnacalis]|uniref:uncharacterized protein LOC114357253 n=1 Tax=Ostrinia furnacalis TaxID=93504 RepID=UPI00103C5F30|nr:uncharacterized protein LOC114357253 [Ostrinia furnacalis]